MLITSVMTWETYGVSKSFPPWLFLLYFRFFLEPPLWLRYQIVIISLYMLSIFPLCVTSSPSYPFYISSFILYLLLAIPYFLFVHRYSNNSKNLLWACYSNDIYYFILFGPFSIFIFNLKFLARGLSYRNNYFSSQCK